MLLLIILLVCCSAAAAAITGILAGGPAGSGNRRHGPARGGVLYLFAGYTTPGRRGLTLRGRDRWVRRQGNADASAIHCPLWLMEGSLCHSSRF